MRTFCILRGPEGNEAFEGSRLPGLRLGEIEKKDDQMNAPTSNITDYPVTQRAYDLRVQIEAISASAIAARELEAELARLLAAILGLCSIKHETLANHQKALACIEDLIRGADWVKRASEPIWDNSSTEDRASVPKGPPSSTKHRYHVPNPWVKSYEELAEAICHWLKDAMEATEGKHGPNPKGFSTDWWIGREAVLSELKAFLPIYLQTRNICIRCGEPTPCACFENRSEEDVYRNAGLRYLPPDERP